MKKHFLFINGFLILSTLSCGGGLNLTTKAEVLDLSPIIYPHYVGVSYSSLKLLNVDNSEQFLGKGISLKIGHRYNKHLSIEARYSKSFKVEYSSGNNILTKDNNSYPSTFSNIGFYLKPSVSIKKASIYALLGYGRVEITNIPQGDVNRAEIGFEWGGGVEYLVSNHISIFSDYILMYQGDGFDYLGTNNKQKADMFSIGFNYHF